MRYRNLIDIVDLTFEEVSSIMTNCQVLKDDLVLQKHQFTTTLKGKQVAMLFEKNSTRTRFSFEVGLSQLGANVIFSDISSTQIARGESIHDSAKVFSRFVDLLVIRATSHKMLKEFSENATIPIINALTDRSHPCQIITDLFTCVEKQIDFVNDEFVWFGDVNNMLLSWIEIADIMGIKLKISVPKGYEEWLDEPIQKILSRNMNIKLIHDPEEAIKNSSVIMTDTWFSMGDSEDYIEQKKKDLMPYQVNQKLMEKANSNRIFLHCLPAHRGEEVTDEVIDSDYSQVFDQAENRLHCQKAIVCFLLGLNLI